MNEDEALLRDYFEDQYLNDSRSNLASFTVQNLSQFGNFVELGVQGLYQQEAPRNPEFDPSPMVFVSSSKGLAIIPLLNLLNEEEGKAALVRQLQALCTKYEDIYTIAIMFPMRFRKVQDDIEVASGEGVMIVVESREGPSEQRFVEVERNTTSLTVSPGLVSASFHPVEGTLSNFFNNPTQETMIHGSQNYH